jgi:hypothetical protein
MRLVLVIVTACYSATPHAWRGDAGPASFSDRWDSLGGQHWTEYLDTVRTLPASLIKLV